MNRNKAIKLHSLIKTPASIIITNINAVNALVLNI
jgi:hypothetical protein